MLARTAAMNRLSGWLHVMKHETSQFGSLPRRAQDMTLQKFYHELHQQYILAVQGVSGEEVGNVLSCLKRIRKELASYTTNSATLEIYNRYLKLIALHLDRDRELRRLQLSATSRRSGPHIERWDDGSDGVFCGRYERLPETTSERQLEGGTRLVEGIPISTWERPLVSIITVVYNNERTLQRCINSVRNQTYENIEHILIDGGSDELTLDLIIQNADQLAYFVSEPDDGIYAAMNKGIRVAQGDYVCLLNSDDFYDPSFVEKAVKVALSEPDLDGIFYTGYRAGQNNLQAQYIDSGILFGHLNICHNTFLTSRNCYDRVGPFYENFKIVSDAVWMRRAFLSGEKFRCLPEPLFTLSDGGLSSGATEEHRRLFINEVIKSYQQYFSNLSDADSEEIYLFRFNKARTKSLLEVAQRYSDDPQITSALRGYVEHCMRDRANFRLSHKESENTFAHFFCLANFLDIPAESFQIETKQGLFSDILTRIDAITSQRKLKDSKVILHFISVFSRPSEAFVYELLGRLDADDDYDNFVLFDHAMLQSERPYAKAIQIHWSDFPEAVAKEIYKYVVKMVGPDVIFAHFALNEWKWAQRIDGIGISVPTITMCHGIDAFAMRQDEGYRKYLVEEFAGRSNTAFTAVSRYLRNELVSNGVPDSEIRIIHNTVDPSFFRNRKTRGFYDGQRPLRLLAVGRLVGWKGHGHLIKALALFKAHCTPDVELTIVYGNGDDNLDTLRALALDFDLSDNVTFVPFVDFRENPGYFAQFDCFVHPSTYTDDALQRSETFGVSVLEAIASGLPVITTDAGGLPEVIGEDRRFARLVPHADPQAMYEALSDMWRDGSAFADNLEYAKERLERFSADRQLTQLHALIDEVTAPKIRAALFSTSTIQGAGYAAFRLHRGLRDTSVVPHIFTTVRAHEGEKDVTVLKHPSGDNNGWRASQHSPRQGLTINTIDETHIPNDRLLDLVRDCDVVNLQWYARFLSVENIAALTRSGKPVVMTIRDMLPITGGCHYFHGCSNWMSHCETCPQFVADPPKDAASVLAAKRRDYNFDNLTLVALSNHSKRIIERAPYFRDCRIEVIPNSIETDVFRPHDKVAARAEFGLPQDRKIIGYVPSFSSEVKGYREITEALNGIAGDDSEVAPFLMLVGNETPATGAIKLDKKGLGYISDKEKLARAYSAADVIVVPSLEETFSNTTAEAISCGVPVVGFRTGAIPELALDGQTGYTCDVGDVDGLARGVTRVLEGSDLSAECRAHAEATLSFMTQARQYEALFKELVERTKGVDAKRTCPSGSA